jgi:hypothetical protein
LDLVIKAIEQGDADKISGNFDKLVDITINKDQSTYSKSQGKVVLHNFFSDNPVKAFSIKHKGSPADNSSVYLIGDLQTKDNKEYRVYLYFKDKSGILFLQEIRFEQ